MVRIVKHGRGLLVVLALLAIAVAACSSGGGAKSSNAATQGPGQSQSAVASQSQAEASQSQAEASQSQAGESQVIPSQGSGDLGGTADALKNISSYKFTMTLAGGDLTSSLAMLGGTGGVFTMSGTVIAKPDKAADINLGTLHIIEVGGVDYLDMSGTGSFISTPASDTSLADSFSPATMFSGLGVTSSGDFNKVGTEQKNGVTADHYVATPAGLSQLSGTSGTEGATWTGDMWVATSGGYPVSVKILATMPDKSIGYEISFDISNVNDPSNTVTKPANVTGG